MRRMLGVAVGLVLAGSVSAQIKGEPTQGHPSPSGGSGGGGFPGLSFSITFGHPRSPEPFAARDRDQPPAEPGVALITGTTRAELEARARATGARILEIDDLDELGLFVAKIRPAKNAAADTAAEPNHLYQSASGPAGPAPARFGLARMKGPAPAPGALIAMVDTPVDRSHEAFAGLDISETNFTGKAAPGLHGTAVASLILGRGEAHGAASGASLLSLAAFTPTRDGGAASDTLTLAKALNAAIKARPAVLNLSFTGPDDRLLTLALDRLAAGGACVVAPVGNAGPRTPVAFPARYGATLAVTAVDDRGALYAWANQGVRVDVAAGGVDLLAAAPGGWRRVSGTSFATAFVSGALAGEGLCGPGRNVAQARDRVRARA